MAFSFSKIFSATKDAVPVGARSIVGIDIGSSSVKVVELEETDAALVLRTYGELQLGPYAGEALGQTVSLKEQQQTEAVVDVIREASVSATEGVLAMPLASSFMTVIPVTTSGDEEIDSKIHIEARKYIPVPLSDVVLNWIELEPIGKAATTARDVMLAAIEHKALGDYNKLLSSIQMGSQPSEVEPFSLVRALLRPEDTTVAVIDLGAKLSKLYIVRNGVLQRTHRVATGGATITKRLSEALGISFQEAENVKRSYGPESSQATDMQKATTSVLSNPLMEFKRMINQYEIRLGEPVGRIVLSGGVAAFPGMAQYAADIFSHEVEIGNPFAKVAYPAFMEDTLHDIAPSFGVSLGAALRHFL